MKHLRTLPGSLGVAPLSRALSSVVLILLLLLPALLDWLACMFVMLSVGCVSCLLARAWQIAKPSRAPRFSDLPKAKAQVCGVFVKGKGPMVCGVFLRLPFQPAGEAHAGDASGQAATGLGSLPEPILLSNVLSGRALCRSMVPQFPLFLDLNGFFVSIETTSKIACF